MGGEVRILSFLVKLGVIAIVAIVFGWIGASLATRHPVSSDSVVPTQRQYVAPIPTFSTSNFYDQAQQQREQRKIKACQDYLFERSQQSPQRLFNLRHCTTKE